MANPPWLERLSEALRRIQRRDEESKAKTESTQRWKQEKERVAGSQDVKWKPIDRTAALVIAPANWIHKPDAFAAIITDKQTIENNKRKEAKVMAEERNMTPEAVSLIPGHDHRGKVWGKEGFEIKPCGYGANGEPLFAFEDMQKVLMSMIEGLPKETNPLVQRAKDARAILHEMLDGVGQDMERFRDNVKHYLEEIRQTRFAVVAEASQISAPLRDLRQFFMGPDYKGEIARLKEFVELCERLTKLKESGFLDRIADTMLALDASK